MHVGADVPTEAPDLPRLPAEHTFAKRMRELRENVGMSQTELAALLEKEFGLKLDGSAITRIENNAYPDRSARIIRLGEAVAIAKALESDLHEMLRPDIPLEVQLHRAQLRAAGNENRARELTEKAADARREVALLEAKLREAEERAEIRSVYDQMLTRYHDVRDNLDAATGSLEVLRHPKFNHGGEHTEEITRLERLIVGLEDAKDAAARDLANLEKLLASRRGTERED
jgi:transcriptional regulator with XRE-family HTH domain